MPRFLVDESSGLTAATLEVCVFAPHAVDDSLLALPEVRRFRAKFAESPLNCVRFLQCAVKNAASAAATEICVEFCDREELQNCVAPPLCTLPSMEAASAAPKETKGPKACDVVLEFAVYSPVDKDVECANARNCIFRLDQEFLMDASQPLSLLKDFVYCVRDYDDASEFPAGFPWVFFAQKEYAAKAAKPCSGFLLLNNRTFFNETRSEACIDYSAPILQWINEDVQRQQTFPSVTCHSLNDCSLERLPFDASNSNRFLYVHQGNCMHCIVLRRIRTASFRDSTNLPALTYLRKYRRRKCFICDVYSAKFMTVNDKHAPENPCYFCGACYDMFHKDERGNLLYSDFTVYKYTHE